MADTNPRALILRNTSWIDVMASESSWYTLTQGEMLEQGDIFFDVPLVELPADFPWPQDEETEIKQIPIHSVDAVVISQTCDLQQPGKLDFVTFCPLYWLEERPEFSSKERRNALRQGRILRYHLLNRCFLEGHQCEFMVVEFAIPFCLPIELTRRLAREQRHRLRLSSPYKEHLSQSFARFFMRVGLPSDIPEFK
ncbi:MAG: hypothetical protein KBH93_03030 [Anaerolineae bacterium]|nr:hypothetical protein [Anaerolineae bacterium]